MRVIIFIISGVFLSQHAWTQKKRVSNSVKAIVGGQKVITQLDVERKAGGPAETVTPAVFALAQKKLEADALMIISIKSREGYVEPAGVPELLLKRELKSRYNNNRKMMIENLRNLGKTIQKREAELWDALLLDNAISAVRQTVQVSPAAIKKYYSENPNVNDKGETVDLYGIRVPRGREGINVAKVQEMTVKVKSLAGFKELAVSLGFANNTHKGYVHKNDPVGLSKEMTAEVFSLQEKEAGFTFDEEAYHILYVEKRWDKFEIPLTDVHKLIEERLAQEIFEQKMSEKEKRIRNKVHVYYPPENSLLLNK
tara:strand:+ start:25 stop:960 length:936 start_codon:yes stop_codon:yes gene_type:complete